MSLALRSRSSFGTTRHLALPRTASSFRFFASYCVRPNRLQVGGLHGVVDLEIPVVVLREGLPRHWLQEFTDGRDDLPFREPRYVLGKR